VFIPRYGIEAAAWSTLISFFVRTVLISALSLNRFPISYEYKRIGYGIGLALVLSAGWFIDIGDLWANLGVKTALILAYPVLIRYSGLLRPEEKGGLRVIRHRLRARFFRTFGLYHD
jgi:O-antigen/teichoic acid export membrane protein